MDLMKGKRVLILGVVNERSIAWGIARAFHREGADIILTYQSETLEKHVRPMANEISAQVIGPIDVTRADHMALLRMTLEPGGPIHGLVHSLAYASRQDLEGRFHETSREGLISACDISAFSLVELVRVLRPILSNDCSVLAMSYLGAEKVVPNYNVMGVAKAALEAIVRYLAADLGPDGIRVNAISAGPVRTLAAMGIPGFRDMQSRIEEQSPLRHNITSDDVGQAALYLASSMSSRVTGQVIHVDSGFSILAPG